MEKKYLTFDEIVSVDCDIEEQETSVAFYRDENIIKWYTSDNTMITKFKWSIKEAPDTYKIYVADYSENGKPSGYFIEMPRDLLSFRKKHREISDEARERASNMMKSRWENKKSKED